MLRGVARQLEDDSMQAVCRKCGAANDYVLSAGFCEKCGQQLTLLSHSAPSPSAAGTGPIANAGLVLVGAVLLYASSFFLPVIAGDAWLPFQQGDWPGGVHAFGECLSRMLSWKVSAGGWWITTLAWLVNPAIWISMLATGVGYRFAARVVALFGLCMALPVLFVYTQEHGVAWHPGFWVWWGSALFLFLGNRRSTG